MQIEEIFIRSEKHLKRLILVWINETMLEKFQRTCLQIQIFYSLIRLSTRKLIFQSVSVSQTFFQFAFTRFS